jgi:tetratricopeptide (TPR) repeat protein
VALLDEVAQNEGASPEDRSEATRLLSGLRRPVPVEALENPEQLESLNGPATVEGLETVWELAEARRAEGQRESWRASLLLYTAACEKSFYLAHVADGQVSAASRATLEEQLVWALLWTGQFDKCATAAARLIALEGAPEVQAGIARYCAAEALGGASEWIAAIEAMWQFVELHPSHALMPDALYFIARALLITHQRPEALAQFKLVAELYPQTNAGAQAAERIRRWSQRPGYADLEEASELAAISGEASNRHMAAIEEVRRRLLAQAPASLPALPGSSGASASASIAPLTQSPLALAAESEAAR